MTEKGEVSISTIKQKFDAGNHPEVIDGAKTEEEILQEFLESFQTNHEIFVGKGKNLNVSKEEFVEYYENISPTFDSDLLFETILRKLWNIKNQKIQITEGGKQKPVYKSGKESPDSPFGKSKEYSFPAPSPKQEYKISPNKKPEEEKEPIAGLKFGNTIIRDLPKCQNILLERFRNKLLPRGEKAIFGLERQFRDNDPEKSGYLPLEDFNKALRNFKLEFDERDVANLTKAFSKKGNGNICYADFLEFLLGKMNEIRRNLVSKAFDSFDEKWVGIVPFELIKNEYDPRNHPDLKANKRTESEVLDSFLNTFETHHNFLVSEGRADEASISKSEFLEYYTKISFAIESDQYFDQMITNCWRLGINKASMKQPFAGVTSKIYQVDSKASWNNDFHKTLFSPGHPMRPKEEVSSKGSRSNLGKNDKPNIKEIAEGVDIAQEENKE